MARSEAEIALLVQLAEQAKEMRRLQRAYFRHPSRQGLEESKAAERELDRLLARRDGVPEQPTFFNEDSVS